MNKTQTSIHRTITILGGYWPPLSGVSRILEELGELHDAFLKNDAAEMKKELADLFIISTCVANQYCAHLKNIAIKNSVTINVSLLLSQLVIQAGEIARRVNHYEGPKIPKKGENFKNIEELISAFHMTLFILADVMDINLMQAVKTKLLQAKKRDQGRFPLCFDPCSSSAVALYKEIYGEKNTKCWGAPEWDLNISLQANILNSKESFKRFLKIAKFENLNAFVWSIPNFLQNQKEKNVWFKNFLREIEKLFAVKNDDEEVHFKYQGKTGKNYFFVVLSPAISCSESNS